MLEVIGHGTKFAQTVNSLGLPLPDAGAATYYLELERKLARSDTALGILGLLERSSFNYYVLVCTSTAMYLDHDHLQAAIGFSGGIAVISPEDEIQLGGANHGEISLIHELGHALQWERHTVWYRGHTRRANSNLQGGGAAVSSAPTSTGDSKYVVETHNVFTHEWPVCDELKVAKRPDYCGAKIDDYRGYWPA